MRAKRMTQVSAVQLAFDLRDDGIARAAEPRQQLVAAIRMRVVKIASMRSTRCATADDVEFVLEALDKKRSDLGNAAGAIFQRSVWTFTGDWKPSIRASNHGRSIRVWQLKQ